MALTLLSSCARATTAAEARFRIDYPLAPARATRVAALDPGARVAVGTAERGDWNHASFFLTGTAGDDPLDAILDGLDAVDALVMVASSAAGADAAAAIGTACRRTGVMTAGLVLEGDDPEEQTLTALRPWARILLVPADADDLVELLRAIRA